MLGNRWSVRTLYTLFLTPCSMLQEYLVTEDTRSTIQAVLKASAEPQFDAFSFWREWLECGSVHEDKQEALVAFANELRHHDVAVDEGRKLWSDLPRLSNAYREQFEGALCIQH